MSTEYTLSVSPNALNLSRLTTDGLLCVDRYSRGSMLQYSKITSAAGASTLGGQVNFVFNFSNDKQLSYTIYHNFLVYTITNKHATETITFPRGVLDHFKSLEFAIDGKTSFKLEHAEIHECYSNFFLRQGHHIYTSTYELRQGELDVVTGVSIGPLASKTFMFCLTPIWNVYGRTLYPPSLPGSSWPYGSITELKINAFFSSEAVDEATASLMCRSSSATVNLFTNANLSITNCGTQYTYQVNTHPTDVVPLFKDLTNSGKKFVQLVPVIVQKEIYTGTITAGTLLDKFVTSDISKINGVQHYNMYLREKPTTYSSANCCLKLSGCNYINYEYDETIPNGQTLSLRDPVRIKQYEMEQYRRDFGQANRLPMEFWNTNTAFAKTYLNMTRLTFDNYAVGAQYETVCHFNNNNIKDDFLVRAYATQTLAGNYTLVAEQVSYRELVYTWNPNHKRYEFIETVL